MKRDATRDVIRANNETKRAIKEAKRAKEEADRAKEEANRAKEEVAKAKEEAAKAKEEAERAKEEVAKAVEAADAKTTDDFLVDVAVKMAEKEAFAELERQDNDMLIYKAEIANMEEMLASQDQLILHHNASEDMFTRIDEYMQSQCDALGIKNRGLIDKTDGHVCHCLLCNFKVLVAEWEKRHRQSCAEIDKLKNVARDVWRQAKNKLQQQDKDVKVLLSKEREKAVREFTSRVNGFMSTL